MITAFVPTLNNEKTLRRVLKAIKAQTVQPARFIVIDSGSADATEKIAREEGFEFYPPSYFGIDGILGLGRARNRILELIDTPYLLSVDSDIVLEPDHIEKIIPLFEQDTELAGIAGRQIELNRIHLGDRCRSLVDMRDLNKNQDELKDELRPFLMGSNNIYKTEALHHVGLAENGNRFRPFEDAFMSNYEDADLGNKLSKHGYKMLWTPSVPTYHLQKDDVRGYISRAYRYRVFKWIMKGAFKNTDIYKGKIEHNINYVRMGIDIIANSCRSYLSYPFFLAGFSFFLEDILLFEKNHPMAKKIYNSFIKSLEFCPSEKLVSGVKSYNAHIIDNIGFEYEEDFHDEILSWFKSLADLSAFGDKFPAFHDIKLKATDRSLKTKAVESSLLRMEKESDLNIYGDFRVLVCNLPRRTGTHFGVSAGSRWPHTYDMSRYTANMPPYIPYPFFLGHLFSLLQNNGISSWITDGVGEGYTDEEMIYEAFGYAPAIIFAETSAPSFRTDTEILRRIKSFLPDTKICLTGSHISFMGKTALDFADFAIQGEFELSALELALCLKNGRSYDHIPGLIHSGGINPMRSDTDFAALPRPERLFTPLYNYNDRPVERLAYPSFQTQLSRGCPYRCCFCLWVHTLYQDGYRKADTDAVAKEIKYAAETFGIRSFYLDDETFNIDKKHLHAFCSSLEKQGVNLPWMAMARADGGLDEEIILKMKQNGLIGLKFGIESTDEKVLKEINKKLDINKCEKNLDLCRKHGIEIHLTFSIGYQAETEETVNRTFEWLLAQNPDSQQISIATPFPGTPMYAKLIKQGVMSDNNLMAFDGHQSLAFENSLGAEKTQMLKKQWIERWDNFKKGK